LLTDLRQLPRQTLQGGPAFEMEKLTGGFIQRSTMVLRLMDIQADIDYFFC
jgi:hypothetical protein